MSFVSVSPAYGLCTLLFVTGISHATSDLRVEIASPKVEYVVGEPVKISITLANAGTKQLRVAEASLLGFQSEYLFVDVAYEGEPLERRKFDYVCEIGIPNPAYEGEPLRPGGRLETALYPNLTRNVRHGNSWRRTFDRPGTYALTIAYEVPEIMTVLGSSIKAARSNTIRLTFRSPSPQEREILEPLWTDGGASLSLGDREIHCLWDRARLAAVIERFPDHAMTPYARLALAKALLVTYDRTYQTEAISVLKTLSRSSPDFRPEEVGLWSAVALYYAGDRTAASAQFASLLRRFPSLRMTPAFVRYRVLSDYGSIEEFRRWKTERRAGIDRYAPREE